LVESLVNYTLKLYIFPLDKCLPAVSQQSRV